MPELMPELILLELDALDSCATHTTPARLCVFRRDP